MLKRTGLSVYVNGDLSYIGRLDNAFGCWHVLIDNKTGLTLCKIIVTLFAG